MIQAIWKVSRAITLTTTFVMALGALGVVKSYAADCESGRTPNQREVCLRMLNLRAQITAMDAQRELMQINPEYLGAMGRSMNTTANEVLRMIGIGIPEHQMGLSGAARLGKEIAGLAALNDVSMLAKANLVRGQCATCHANQNPPNGADWGELFGSDWSVISSHCSEADKNPYLCRSMNGMMSAFGVLFTAHDAGIKDFELTGQAASEIARILVDLKAKNFNHLPGDLRDQAEADSREVAQLAADKNPLAFQKAVGISQACMNCHQANMINAAPFPLKAWSWTRWR